jgi:NTP pyrophosphatase (non-canonical NTP hydrolase)
MILGSNRSRESRPTPTLSIQIMLFFQKKGCRKAVFLFASKCYRSGMGVEKIRDAQKLVKDFASRNGWKDEPTIDKFDHLHEELIEMSQHLRYKNEQEKLAIIKEKADVFKDGIGDLFFALCRLANQLDVDMEDAFNMVGREILSKYDHKGAENNLVK